MMKRMLILVLSLLAIGLLPGSGAAEVKKIRVAVLDFAVQGSGTSGDDLGPMVAEMFLATLAQDGRFDLVERNLLKKILQEQVLAQSGALDETSAAKAGRLLGVNSILTGTVMRMGTSTEISARFIDAENASIRAAEIGTAEAPARIREAVAELSGRLVRNFMTDFQARAAEPSGQDAKAGTSGEMSRVRGLVGTEKLAIFNDPKTLGLFQKGSLLVRVEGAGSRQMLADFDPSAYDFVFPSGTAMADQIARSHRLTGARDLFFTPMVVASWRPIAELLAANGLATREGETWFLDMAKMMDCINQGKTWADLQDNQTYKTRKPILITSTDLKTSSSASMYLAIASYVANGNRIVSSEKDVKAVAPKVKSLFVGQGSQAASSRGPFDDYLAMGMGGSPLVMAYEAQFIEAAAANRLSDDMVLLYPRPTVYVKGVFLPMTEAGRRALDLMTADEEFGRVAAEHGMHPKNGRLFQEHVTKIGLHVPASLIDVINLPEHEVLEQMIPLITN